MTKYNPFRPGSVVAPGMFCGRHEEIIRIEQSLFQTKRHNPQHFIFEGERGIGKTSLLLRLEYVARGVTKPLQGKLLNFMVVRIELQRTTTSLEIVKNILIELKREIDTRAKMKALATQLWDFVSRIEAMGVKYRKDAENIDELHFVDDLTNTLIDIINSADEGIDGVLILIDEADKPQASASLGLLCKLLTERLTRKQCERVCIGMAGLPGLISTLRQSHESSPRMFSIMSLEPLEHKECEEAIMRGLSKAETENGFRTQIADDAKGLIARLSEGYPHFLQEFAHWAFAQDRDNYIDLQDVVKGAFSENGALDQLGVKYFHDLYIGKIGSDDYRKVLHAMTGHSDRWVGRPKIIAESGLQDRTVDNALRALKDRKIILANPRVRGEYRLPTKSFAVWIKARESRNESAEVAAENSSDV